MRTQEGLSREARLLDAAEQVVQVQSRYAQAGIGLAQAALAGARRCEPLRHYPAADVIDRQRGLQFYYHAHSSHRPHPDEHGHFHLFVRNETEDFFHVAALSLDARGWPLRWFTTNRWVTGERWVGAAQATAALPHFRPATHGRLAPVAQWLGAMVVLYEHTLATLLRRRDEMVNRRLARAPAEVVFEDRGLDVITENRVSLPQRLAQLIR